MDTNYRIVVELSKDTDLSKVSDLFLNDSNSKFIPTQNTPTTKKLTKDWRESDINIETIKPMHSLEDKDSVVSKYLGHGIIKLFKLKDETKISTDEGIIIPGDDTMVSILFIPTYFTVHDLLHFYIGDEIINNQITNFRILKNVDGSIGLNFMVLMKFKESINAKLFKENFNGKTFSKVDPERCHVVSIKEIVFKNDLFETTDINHHNTNIPYLVKDPFTMNGYNDNEIELPTCPVCLERMDSQTTGLITIPCQHTFHCQCLDKWKNSRCPVCRFSSFRLSRDSLLKQMGNSPQCIICNSKENLWACLVCGNIGCGRYNSKHAIQHFETTSHCFAMDIKTQRVWDYAGDNYVHRLVQNEVDGKLVEVALNMDHTTVSSSSREGEGNTTEQASNVEKNSDMLTDFMRQKEYHLEYVQVLVSQLESQREYYEEKLQKKNDTEEEDSAITNLKLKLSQLSTSLHDEQQRRLEKEKFTCDKIVENGLIMKGLQENLDRQTKLNEQYLKDITTLKEEKSDLQDQVKDLMFYLETQEKFKDATEEERNGSLVIKNPMNSTTKNRNKKKKKKIKIPTLEEIGQK
ncbi:similar to Saccharomyces cerevisiae YHL010C ETP1 Putative protein of unknown function that is required for growth on ethanol [Maudiozyma saulgeensis]|uniref:RING-type domain-containing protein n=1 Tax=Maudiozyma saulgeensis TaxID=1789683 RepID=A0A1X7R848_9SACH|nr:similar to Saccharomyces cerevisiae YHL010C ETP1 Putative protein of unknown function that is required for growth on ethanol [Kazachstania saulgeensis]